MTAPWAALTPDAAYNLLALGDGEATTVAAGAAWQAQTIEGVMNAGLSQANTAMTAPAWIGEGGTASATSATVMNALLDALSGWAQAKVPIAESAAAAYRSALSMMIPTPECLANRAEQAHDVGINPLVWGALTPDIVRLDTQYFGFYWPNNAAQGTAYSALLLGFLSTLAIPPPVGAPPGSAATAPAEAAAQIAQTAAQSSTGDAMRESMQSGLGVTDQLAGSPPSMMEPLMSAAQAPMQAAESLSSPLQGMMSAPTQGLQQLMAPLSQFAGMFGQGAGPAAAADAVLPATGAVPPSAAALGGGAVGGGSGVVGGAGVPATGLTSYTRPTSSFGPDATKGGTASYARPGGVAPAGGASSVPVSGGAPIAPMGGMARNSDSKKDEKTKTARLSL